MASITDFQYYTNGGTAPTDANCGSYQFMSLNDIVNNFELMHVGNDKQLNNVPRYEILFHAKQGIKEFNYDALKNVKVLELTLGSTIQMVMPPDYVNFIRISYEHNGTLFPMVENVQMNYANSYLQDVNNDIVFDVNGNVVEVQSQLDISRLAFETQQMYLGQGLYNNRLGWCIDGEWYFGFNIGARFGSNPETSNVNGTYKIDKANGVINFGSDLTGKNVVLEYVSDGLEKGDDLSVSVNKLAEDAIYKHIKWALLNNKYGITMYEKNEAKKQRKSAIDNAKIRIGGNMSKLLMVLRNQGKWIK